MPKFLPLAFRFGYRPSASGFHAFTPNVSGCRRALVTEPSLCKRLADNQDWTLWLEFVLESPATSLEKEEPKMARTRKEVALQHRGVAELQTRREVEGQGNGERTQKVCD